MKFLTTFVRVVSIVVCLIGASAATAQGVADPVVNEFVVNHTGSDTHEFLEILGDADTRLFSLYPTSRSRGTAALRWGWSTASGWWA